MEDRDRQIRRRHRLALRHTPSIKAVEELHPDDDGLLPPVSWTEAREKGLKFYTSRKISRALDSVFLDTDGQLCVLRYTANGMTAGELGLIKALHADRRKRDYWRQAS